MANIDAGFVRGPQGPQGIKGDPFTYADFTQDQIAGLQRPATEAAMRADKATEDAQAAIADVKATEAKLYPVAENTLKGKTKETFVHVDDAFAGAALREITIEGAYKQDGTPSPDNPVPIQVVENPVVRVTGRNLLDIHEGMPESDCNKDFGSETKRIIKPGTYIAGLTSNNYFSANVLNVQIGNGAVSFHSDTGGYGIGFGVSLVPGVTYKFDAQGYAEFKFAFYSADGTWLSQDITSTPTVPINAVYSVLVITTKGNSSDVALRDIYGAATQITYEPYVGTSIPFALPTEHPYLAKLPDGTADEIMVDRDGNVSLIANVGIDNNVRTVGDVSVGKYYEFITHLTPFTNYASMTSTRAMCSAVPSRINGGNGIYRTWNGVYVSYDTQESNDELQSIIDKVAPITVIAAIPPVTYQLGKIEMPKAQDSIINVWTDAEVTPKTGIEYTRDVNIVVTNLESAIASIS